ncbi:hypothetical protein PIB30_040079, partial [Stylosanthes scabra]|nr:hypothetical protein [Stylosanthes scabra]
ADSGGCPIFVAKMAKRLNGILVYNEESLTKVITKVAPCINDGGILPGEVGWKLRDVNGFRVMKLRVLLRSSLKLIKERLLWKKKGIVVWGHSQLDGALIQGRRLKKVNGSTSFPLPLLSSSLSRAPLSIKNSAP